ncbi:response regulator [Chloroflexia bacterium SDU3-3]|nr:response regulator [Chloroflexia bacterium SDU3-3]
MAKILIVDDSTMSRRMLRRFLEADGHQIIEADDGLVAIERYMLEHPDLVTLDMTMRGMHGLDVLAQLRALDPAARVLVATADIQRSTRDMVHAAGGSGFLSKPFEEERVRRAVAQILTGGRAWN